MTHDELVRRSVVWLRRHGCCVVATEVIAWCCREAPDVIGWDYGGISFVIEAKVTRSDFLADKNKPHRNGKVVGLGNMRYYAAPKGMIQREELPDGWGLIETSGHGMRLAKAPTSQEANEHRERVLLVQLYRYSYEPHWGAAWRERHNVDAELLPREVPK